MTIEILMATYNGEKYLREQINSILNQTDQDWHLTISDDGSTDGTVCIVRDYIERYPDRIKQHCAGHKFGNARDHFFYLMRSCQAEWMMFCDQDDTWYPEKIMLFRKEMTQAEEKYGKDAPLLIFSDQTPTDAELNPLAPSLMRYQKQYFKEFDYRSILIQNVVTGGAMMINQKLAALGGKCSDTSSVIMHDWWLAVVAARFGHIIYIDKPTGTYRQHGDNSVGAKNVRSIRHIVNKIMDLEKVKSLIFKKKKQGMTLWDSYSLLLIPDDVIFLKQFAKNKSGIYFYIKYYGTFHGIFRFMGMLLLG